MLPTLIGTVAVAWIAVFLSHPRRPAGYDEAPWFVYSRDCGARDRILLLALVVTGAAFFTGVIALGHSAQAATQTERGGCLDVQPGQTPTCYRMNADNVWELWQRDDATGGKWRGVSTIPPRETHKP